MKSLRILVAIPSLFLVSCIGTDFESISAGVVQPPVPQENESIVCIYRKIQYAGGGNVFDVSLDSKRIAALPISHWTYISTTPGIHSLGIKTASNAFAGRGRTYEHQCEFLPATSHFYELSVGMIKPIKLREINSQKGQTIIQNKKFSTIR
jgi:hypothetical protein